MTDPAANKAGPQTAAPPLPPLPKLLSGQKALVTGANSGIGKAVALGLGEDVFAGGGLFDRSAGYFGQRFKVLPYFFRFQIQECRCHDG